MYAKEIDDKIMFIWIFITDAVMNIQMNMILSSISVTGQLDDINDQIRVCTKCCWTYWCIYNVKYGTSTKQWFVMPFLSVK